jgi:hypothetical protein
VATEQVESQVQTQLEPKSGSKTYLEVNDNVDLKETEMFGFGFGDGEGSRWFS